MLNGQTRQRGRTRRRAAAALAAAVLVLTPTPSDACTSFRAKASAAAGGYLLAKNYDWAVGGGVVVAMPPHRRETALRLGRSGAEAQGMTWTAQYGSLAFTQFAVGLTISGMNEKGLTIETLVNASHPLPSRPAALPPSGLVSLQWVQYQLDTAASVDEVVRSLRQVQLVQAFLPVHFLVCDPSGAVAVVESDARGRAVVSRPTGVETALANRDWSVDVADAKLNTPRFQGITLAKSSAYRVAHVREALADAGAAGMTVSQAFDLLEAVRMIGLTRWQLVWDLADRTVHWQSRSALGRIGTRNQATLAELPTTCSDQTLVAAPLGGGAAGLAERPRASVDALVAATLAQNVRLLGLRGALGNAGADELQQAAAAMRAQSRCL